MLVGRPAGGVGDARAGLGGALVSTARHSWRAHLLCLAVLAAQAGCDLLEVCSGHDDQVAAMEGLIRAIEAEEVPGGETWQESLERALLPEP